MPSGKRLLFASYHGYIDPSSGAAVSVRELLTRSCSGFTISPIATGGCSRASTESLCPRSVRRPTIGWRSDSGALYFRACSIGIECRPSPGRQYVTFVNPQPHKGVFVFARIAEQLHRRRPDIPFLIVEGRCGVEWLQRTGLDLSGLTNLNVMRNTPDPRDFYRASRLILMPSLWRESFGRVAAEAMISGIPVLASSRGALAEVVGEAGFLFEIPARYTPETRTVATAEEVAPWVDTIIRLWDNTNLYQEAACRCRKRAEAWRAETLLPRYEELLQGVMRGR